MRLVLAAAIVLSLAAPAFAADSAKTILDRHERTIKAGDLDGVMADYADNAVLLAPAGVVPGQTNLGGLNLLIGKANIRKFFAVLTSKESNPAVKSMAATYDIKADGTATMSWKQWPGTPKEVSGTDVWIIRDGKVISQTVLVNPAAPAKK